MRVHLTEASPGGATARVALLHEGRDPAAGVRASIRGALRQAVRSVRFRGDDKEVATSGAWTLIGLGRAPASAGRLRAALRRALKDVRKTRRTAIVLDEGLTADALRGLLP